MKNLKFRLKTKIRHRIKLNKRVLDFNKEVLIGEIGAIVGATLFGFLGSLISRSSYFIPIATLVGSIFGGSISMLTARIRDEKKYKTFSTKKLWKDISTIFPSSEILKSTIYHDAKIIFVQSHKLSLRFPNIPASPRKPAMRPNC